jgi:hypothetical protein
MDPNEKVFKLKAPCISLKVKFFARKAGIENWERIQDFRLEDGARPEVISLPMPGPLFFDGVVLHQMFSMSVLLLSGHTAF